MTCFVRKTVSGRAVVTVLAVLMMGAAASFASTTVGIIDWDTNPPDTPWVADDGDVAVSITGPIEDRSLLIGFDASGDPLSVLVSGRTQDLFAGTWSSESWIEFDFWSDGTDPTALEVRWGADGSTNVWAYAVNPSPVNGSGWQTLRTASFGDGGDWNSNGLGNPAEFLANLSSIDWIGVYIGLPVAGAASYGIDDFSLMVPEPAEILMLAAAFGVGLQVFRRMRLVPRS